MNFSDIKFDCLYFKGDIPCIPHKEKGEKCDNCLSYKKIQKRVLIIKLAALGDVIRTTPILEALEDKYGVCHFTWLTQTPEILKNTRVDKILSYTGPHYSSLSHDEYDVVINLDKDKEACILISAVNAEEKYGYYWNNGHIDAYNKAGKNKILTGIDDELSEANEKSYLEEIFEITELDFKLQEYQINLNQITSHKWAKNFKALAGDKKIVGLNTGCGPRWKTRLWPLSYWEELATQLKFMGYFVVLLGGEQEDIQNKQLAEKTGVFYPGYFSLQEFIALSNNLNIVVTQVSMMMHIATALKKSLVLMNNIFNKHEFEMYNRGVIVEPSSSCDCYFGTSCSRNKSCMYDIKVKDITEQIPLLLNDQALI